MAPITRLKTYGKTKKTKTSVVQRDYNLWDVSANNSNLFPVTSASRAIDSLLAKNVEKRDASFKEDTKKTRAGSRKSKRLETAGTGSKVSPRFLDVSFNLRINSTFDNLLQGPKYRSVQVCNVSSLCGESSIENSYCHFKKIALSPIQNPKLHKIENNVKTRRTRKKKNGVITKGKIVKKNTGKKLSKIIKNIPNINSSNNVPKKLYSYLDESINHSLIIERVKRPQHHNMISKSISDHSSYNCARKFTPIIAKVKTKGVQLSVENNSFQFPLSFRRCMQAQNSPKYNLLSSTPIVPRNGNRQEDFAQWSPITSKSTSRLKISNSNNSLPTNKSANNRKHSSSVIVIDSLLSEKKSFKTKNDTRKRNDLKLDYTPVVKLDKSLDILGISGHLSLASLKPPSKKKEIPKVYLTQASSVSSLSSTKNRASHKIEDKKQNFSPTVNLTRYSFSTSRKKTARTSHKRSKIRKIPNVLLEKLSIASFMKNSGKRLRKTVDNNYSNKTDGNKSTSTTKKKSKNSRGRKLNNEATSTQLLQDKNKNPKKKVPRNKNKMTLKKGKKRLIIADLESSTSSSPIQSKISQRNSLNCTTKSSNKSYNSSRSLFDDQPISTKNHRITRFKSSNLIEIIDLTDDTLYPAKHELKITDDKIIREKRRQLKTPNKCTETSSQTVQTTAINNKPKLRVTRLKSVSGENFFGIRTIFSDLEKSITSFNNSANDSEMLKVRYASNNLKNNKSPPTIKPKVRMTRSASVSVNCNDSKIVSSTSRSLNNSQTDLEVFNKRPKLIRNASNNLFDADKPFPIIKPRLRTTRSYSVSPDSCNNSTIVSNTPKSLNSSANDPEVFKVPKLRRKISNGFINNSFDADKSSVIIKPRLRMTRLSSVSLDNCNACKIDKSSVSNTSKSSNSSANDSEVFKVSKSIKHSLNNLKNNSFDADISSVIIKPRLRMIRSSSVSVDNCNAFKIDKSSVSNTPKSLNNSANDPEVFKVPKPRRKISNGFINNSFDADKSPVTIKPKFKITKSTTVSVDSPNNSMIDESLIISNISKSVKSSEYDSEVFILKKPIKHTSNGFKNLSFDADKSPVAMNPKLRTSRSFSISYIDGNDSKTDNNTSNSTNDLENFKVPLTIKPRLRMTRFSSVSIVDDNKNRDSNFASLKEASNTSENNSSTIKSRLRITRSSSVYVPNRDDSNEKNGRKLSHQKISVSDVLKSISLDANKTSSNASEEFVDFENVVKEFVIEKSRQVNKVSSTRKNNVQFDVNTADQSTKRPPSISLDTWENFSQRRNEVSICELNTSKSMRENGRKTLLLKPGKQWFRSLSILRNTTVFEDGVKDGLTRDSSVNKGGKWRQSVVAVKERQNQSVLNAFNNPEEISNNISRSGSLENRRTTLQIVKARREFSRSLNRVDKTDNDIGYVSTFADESILESLDKLSLTTDAEERDETARQIVLRRCGQTLPVLFDECYSQRILTRCRKIGEGVYGEVFMYKSLEGQCRVMKVIPIEGDMLVNGEQQKKFEEIISEIVIASELSNLRTNAEFCTDGFNELLKICCLKGKYPQHLLDLWELYDEDHGSENDSPQIFTDDQLYIVLELSNGGQDLEAFRFKNAEQSYAVFIQVVCSLAVAEAALEFEHRDMHWGNILICPTDEPTATFRLNGREFEVATRGVKVSIIDFTLSRMTFNNCCIFNDLALDADLFSATGDYQFDIYRLMQQRNRNKWQHFEPHSNVLWLDYTLEKMITHLRYVRVNSKTHKNSIRRLSQLKKNILDFNSAAQFLNSDVFSHVFL